MTQFIREIPISKITDAPELEELPDADRAEMRLIGEEMAFVLCYKLINELDTTEKFIIRHSFGLPMVYHRGKYYEQLPRTEIAQRLGIHRFTVKKIRENALKKLFKMVMDG